MYRVAGTQFGIYPSDNAGTNKATAVRFVVSDFDVVRAELLSKGVVFEDYDLGDDFRTVDGVLVSPDGREDIVVQGLGRKHPRPRLFDVISRGLERAKKIPDWSHNTVESVTDDTYVPSMEPNLRSTDDFTAVVRALGQGQESISVVRPN